MKAFKINITLIVFLLSFCCFAGLSQNSYIAQDSLSIFDFSKFSKYDIDNWTLKSNKNQNITIEEVNKIDSNTIELCKKLSLPSDVYLSFSFFSNAECRLFINGEEIKNHNYYSPYRINNYNYTFLSKNKDVELCLYIYAKQPIKITTPQISNYLKFETKNLNFYALSFISLGGILIFCIFFLLFYIYTKELTNLILSIFLFLLSLLSLLHIDDFNYAIVSFLNSHFFTLSNFIFILQMFFLFYYFIKLENLKNRIIANIKFYITLLTFFTTISIFVPIEYYNILQFVELLVFATSIVFMMFSFNNLTLKRILIFILGFILLFCSYIFYIFSNEIPHFNQYLSIGAFIYTIAQSINLTIRNNKLEIQEEQLLLKNKIESEIKQTLLQTPAYDVSSIISQIQKHLHIEKCILITNENEEYYNYIVSYLNVQPILINKKIDFNESNNYFETQIVKETISTQSIVEKDIYENNTLTKSIFSIPIVDIDRIIAIVYFENISTIIEQFQKNILINLRHQIKILIDTAVSYFQLSQLKQFLENHVKQRTKTVEKQKEELQNQKEKLYKLIEELENKNKAILELNDELNNQIEELTALQNHLELENTMLAQKSKELLTKNEYLNNNIMYAQKIMSYIIRNDKYFDNFIYIDLPKNIIGGDFYFAKKIDKYFVFALADCTGHGIPGALMSIFSHIELQKTIINYFNEYKSISSNKILDILRQKIKERLNYSADMEIKDGLDISLCVYNTHTNELEFSGAYNHILLKHNSEIIVIKGDRMPVGAYVEQFEKQFSSTKIKLSKGDLLYLLTDGYFDQFSSEKNEKFMIRRFIDFLKEIQEENIEKQRDLIFDKFLKWKGTYNQIDDVSAVIIQI